MAPTAIEPTIRAAARRLRAEPTEAEKGLWRILRGMNARGAARFRRQAPIGRAIVDFADFGRRIVIEVDGGQHGGPADAARDAWLAGQGFRVMRFWNSDVLGNPEGVAQTIADALAAATPPQALTPPQAQTPPPSPPHKGEGRRPGPERADTDIAAPSPLVGEGGGGGRPHPHIPRTGEH